MMTVVTGMMPRIVMRMLKRVLTRTWRVHDTHIRSSQLANVKDQLCRHVHVRKVIWWIWFSRQPDNYVGKLSPIIRDGSRKHLQSKYDGMSLGHTIIFHTVPYTLLRVPAMYPFLEPIVRDTSDRIRCNATLNPVNKGSEHVMRRRSKRR